MTRTTISVSDEVFQKAKAAKEDRTWDELILDGARSAETGSKRDEGQDEGQAEPLTADDIPMLKREVADELENRMTRR